MILRRLFALLCPGLLLLGSACASPLVAKERLKFKSWIDGPVRYIARKDEMRSFRALKSEDERALFIERFWARRDPTAQTLINEYRQLFWERVQQANTNFLDSTKDGAMTDRGKVHILYGPPTETQEDIHLETQGLPTGGRGLIRWIYEGRPGQRMDLNPIVVVPFVRDASGEYRISHDPQLASVFFDANAIREQQSKNSAGALIGGFTNPRNSELSVMLDLGKMQEVPPHEQVLVERVEMTESYRTLPLNTSVNRYTDPADGRSVVVINVGLEEAAATPTVIAKFTALDPTNETRMLGEGSFRTREHKGMRTAQARIKLAPGRYALTAMVADPLRTATGLHRATIEVPERNDRLRFSDIVWADELEPIPYAALASHIEPFIVGAFRALPRLDSSFCPGDDLRLFYEIYGAVFPVQVSYQLEGRDADGSWVRLSAAQSAEQAGPGQGWELSSGESWPVGEYRVVIEVVDSDGKLISTHAPFRLGYPDPSSAPAE